MNFYITGDINADVEELEKRNIRDFSAIVVLGNMCFFENPP